MNKSHPSDVGEQLAEALPVLGQAALKHATEGIRSLLAACPNPTHQKLMIWLWTLGYERFGPASLADEGAGFRLWIPNEGADFAVAIEDVEVAARIAPVKNWRDELAITGEQIESKPRSTASSILDHLAKQIDNKRRKEGKLKEPEQKQERKKQSEFIVRPADGPRVPVDLNNPLVRAIGDLLLSDSRKQRETSLRTDGLDQLTPYY